MENENKEDITIKQKLWLSAYLETGNATEAAMRVYNCSTRESAATIGWENLRKLDFSEAMEAKGITIALLLGKLLEGLNSENEAIKHKTLELAIKCRRILDSEIPYECDHGPMITIDMPKILGLEQEKEEGQPD